MLKKDIPMVARALKAALGDGRGELDGLLGKDAADSLISAAYEIRGWCRTNDRPLLTTRQIVERLWYAANKKEAA